MFVMIIYGLLLSVNSYYWLEMAICEEWLLVKNYCLLIGFITGLLLLINSCYPLIIVILRKLFFFSNGYKLRVVID